MQVTNFVIASALAMCIYVVAVPMGSGDEMSSLFQQSISEEVIRWTFLALQRRFAKYVIHSII